MIDVLRQIAYPMGFGYRLYPSYGVQKRAVKLVQEWVFCNRQALEENWKRAMVGEPLKPIEPLE